MSSYQPLADYLAARKGAEWDASFDDVERALGRPLPRSAYRYNAWWANQSGPGHSQTHGWRSVGWRTSKLDLERRRVRFERERPAPSGTPFSNQGSPASNGDQGDERSALIERAVAVSGITDREALFSEALRALIAREVARGLIALGGTMPDFEPAPRERPWS